MKRELTDAQKSMIISSALAVLLTVLSILLGVSYPLPQPPLAERASGGLNITHFTALSAEDITATDDLSVGGDLTEGGLELASTSALTLTPGLIITPTATVYLLSATASVTMTLGGACTNGQLVYLVGDDVQTITVQDANIRTHDGGALSLTQYGIAALLCNRDAWLQLAEVANS